MRKVLRLAWFERTHTFRTSRALVVMLAIVVAVCYCLQGFVVSAVRSHASNVEKHSNVSVIELSTIRPDARVLDGESLSEVSGLGHVVSVVPWMQHDLDLADEGDWPSPTVSPGSLWATTYFEPRLPKMIKGDRPVSLQDDEILLPDSVPGGSLRHLYGKTVMFGYTHINGKYQGSYRTIPLKVVGIYDNSVPDKDGENLGPEETRRHGIRSGRCRGAAGCHGHSCRTYEHRQVHVPHCACVLPGVRLISERDMDEAAQTFVGAAPMPWIYGRATERPCTRPSRPTCRRSGHRGHHLGGGFQFAAGAFR